jgi:hypothetical protein
LQRTDFYVYINIALATGPLTRVQTKEGIKVSSGKKLTEVVRITENE